MRTVLIALTLCAGLASLGSAYAAPKGKPQVTEAERAYFRTEISKSDIVALIMNEFPAEYALFETQLLTDAAAGLITPTQGRARISEFISTFPNKYRPFVGQAREEEIVDLVRRRLAAGKALQRVNQNGCYVFEEGLELTAGLYDSLPAETRAAIDSYNNQKLKVGISGSRLKIVREPLKNEELFAVIRKFEELGGDRAYFIGFEDGGVMSPEMRCRSAILWQEVILAQSQTFIARFEITK